MRKIKGNLIKKADNGEFDIIVHGCNCYHAMKAGIAKAIVDRWPQVEVTDNNTDIGPYKLGSLSATSVDTNIGGKLLIINAYTQVRPDTSKRAVDYGAIAECFRRVALLATPKNLRVGIPLIGCGLAGGDWEVVEEIINFYTKNTNLTLVEYDDTV